MSRRTRNSRPLTLLAALAAAFAIVGTAAATPARQAATNVNVCYANAATDFTPAFIAKNEGFFAQNGLNVNLILASGGKGAQFLASGVCDLNLDSGTPNITAKAQGADFVLLGADANTFDFRLVASGSVPNVKGLVGHTLALSSPGAAVDIAGRAMLQEFGINASDVKIVYISSLAARLAALQAGSIDAMVISPPIAKVLAGGNYKMIYNLKGLHFILSGLWSTRTYANNNADVVKAYIRSDVQAIAWMKNPANKQGVLNDVAQVTGFTDPGDLQEAYDDVLKYQQPEPLIDQRSLKNSLNWVNTTLPANVDVNSFLDLGPLQQVLTRQLSSKLTAGQTVPRSKGAKAAAGTFSGTVTPAGLLSWKLVTTGLTGPVTYAEVHVGKAGHAAPTVLRLCAACKASASGTAKVYGKVLTAFKSSNVFVTVSTKANPKGEIRGQVAAALS